jgi:glycosyltransferase family protein
LKIQRDYGIPKILSVDETLDKIITEKLSVCRYGDGEFKIMDGDSIQFQGESSDLAQRLKKVVKSNRDDVLVCLPSFFDRRHKKLETVITLSKEEKKRKKLARKYMDNIIAERRLQWYSYLDMNSIFGDSLISRFYAGVYDEEKSKRWLNKWKKIWNDRNLLIIEGYKTRLGVGNDLFNNSLSIRRILAPAKSAYDVYDKIIQTVEKEYTDNDLILIALGPTATVLAYDLAVLEMQAIDIGHIDIEYEWFLRKDRTHQKIDGKFVSEAHGGSEVSDAGLDDLYFKQIIGMIGDMDNA